MKQEVWAGSDVNAEADAMHNSLQRAKDTKEDARFRTNNSESNNLLIVRSSRRRT